MSKKRSKSISTFGSRLTSIISVSLVLFVLGALAMLALVANSTSGTIRSNVGFIVKMQPYATDTEVQQMKQLIENSGFADSYVYTSAEDVLSQELQYNEEILDLIDENPYAPEFEVRLLKSHANPDSIKKLTQRLNAHPLVGEVVTSQQLMTDVSGTIDKLMVILGVAAGVLLLISIVLIYNTVSLSIYSRRFAIHTMKLVGATGAFIRKPFFFAGLVNGLISALVACALLASAVAYVHRLDPEFTQILRWLPECAIIGAGVIFTGMLICSISSIFATNRYLRLDYDDMFMK